MVWYIEWPNFRSHCIWVLKAMPMSVCDLQNCENYCINKSFTYFLHHTPAHINYSNHLNTGQYGCCAFKWLSQMTWSTIQIPDKLFSFPFLDHHVNTGLVRFSHGFCIEPLARTWWSFSHVNGSNDEEHVQGQHGRRQHDVDKLSNCIFVVQQMIFDAQDWHNRQHYLGQHR